MQCPGVRLVWGFAEAVAFHPAALRRAECISTIFLAANRQLWLGTTQPLVCRNPSSQVHQWRGQVWCQHLCWSPDLVAGLPTILSSWRRNEGKRSSQLHHPRRRVVGQPGSPHPTPREHWWNCACLFSSLLKELLCNCSSSLVGWIQTCGARQHVLPQDLFPCRLRSSSCKSAH